MTDDARASLRASFGSQEGAAQTARAISAKAAAGPAFDPAMFERIVADHMRAEALSGRDGARLGRRARGYAAVATLVISAQT